MLPTIRRNPLPSSSTLKTEAASLSKVLWRWRQEVTLISPMIYQSTRCHILEDRISHSYRWENLRTWLRTLFPKRNFIDRSSKSLKCSVSRCGTYGRPYLPQLVTICPQKIFMQAQSHLVFSKSIASIAWTSSIQYLLYNFDQNPQREQMGSETQ
jgi:hypothetical protein